MIHNNNMAAAANDVLFHQRAVIEFPTKENNSAANNFD
jgi:hypothetical protein